MQNKTKLAIVIVVIATAIGYLEYSKNIGRIYVKAGSADIPLSLDGAGSASTTALATGQCTTEYCTTTASTKPAAELNAKNNQDVAKVLADKSSKYPRAKELVSIDGYINSPSPAGSSAPFKIADLIGKKIIIVDFWTYSCINCQRTLPYLNAWYAKYRGAGLEIIGVETPEFDFEKNKANVQAAVKKYGIEYPVVQDNARGTWGAYENFYWPHKYIIDVDGFIVYDHIGEGAYEETEQVIQKLLQEKAAREGKQLDFSGTVAKEVAKKAVVGQSGVSPETYFGLYRAGDYAGNLNDGVLLGGDAEGLYNFTKPPESSMEQSKFYLGGKWNLTKEYIQTNYGTATITYKYTAKSVYFVASSVIKEPITVGVYKDGINVKDIIVKDAGLYTLIDDKNKESHTLELRINGTGLQAYTFTFG